MGEISEKEKEAVEKKGHFIINVIYFVIIFGAVVLFMRYGLHAIMPFFIAFFIAMTLRPIVRWFNKYLKMPKKICSFFLVVGFFCTIGFATVILIISAIEYITGICKIMPSYVNDELIPLVTEYNAILNTFLNKYNIYLDLNEIITYIAGGISKLSTALIAITGSVAISVPKLIVDLIVCVVSTYFFTADMDVFMRFIKRQLSPRGVNIFNNVRTHFKRTIWYYVRSYTLIVFITFSELIVGFLIIGIQNPWAVAFIIAIFDILPIVGCGTILLPWIIIALIQGDTNLTIGLLILYVVITVIRNIVEPKIVGDQVGLHPLVTLLAMILGSYIFGPIGLLGFPVALVIIKDLNEEGIISIFKNSKSSKNNKSNAKENADENDISSSNSNEEIISVDDIDSNDNVDMVATEREEEINNTVASESDEAITNMVASESEEEITNMVVTESEEEITNTVVTES